MLASAIFVSVLLAEGPVSADSAASRQISAPCRSVGDRAIHYLRNHDFFASRKMVRGEIVDDLVIELVNRKHASTPSATPLSLNRFSIQRYTLPRHLSPLKAYDDFKVEGELTLTETTEGSCNATLRFNISVFEWVWALGAIDDGYRSQLIERNA
jgi:hypothetical protein